MVKHNFITKEQLIALYMFKFKTSYVDSEELKRWLKFLTKKFSEKRLEAMDLYLRSNYQEIKEAGRGIFVKINNKYFLQKNVTMQDLDDSIIQYVHVDLLFTVIDLNGFTPKIEEDCLRK